ncbi:alpha/beta fold hydrolase [Castellaniella sp.]|uniref:alpha/beta fold hydrolase n=1 Tax=Castellaniella sp. TaxID=1955812 RepID=UPI0025BA76AB|nr:alpha/beta fold hydrolase [Castellaniella sp.]
MPGRTLVRAGSGQLQIMVAGQGQGVVLFHSMLADHASFSGVFEPLSRSHKVTSVSLPGFGVSDPVRGELEVVADHLAAALGSCDLGVRPVFIGNGYGAFLAIVLAMRHPHLADKLVLVGCGTAFSESGRAAFVQMRSKAKTQGLSAVADIAMARLFSGDFREKHPDVLAQCREHFLAMSPDTFDDACQSLATLDLGNHLHKVVVPVLVVVGEGDEATPPVMARQLVAALPNARLHVLPGCAHVPQLQDPQSFLAAIREFVDTQA